VKVSLFCCAAGSVVDKLSGKLSIFNLITDVGVNSLPLFFPKIAIVGVIHRESADADKSDILLVGSINEENLFSHKVKVEFNSSRTNLLTVNINGLKIDMPGFVKVNMVYNDKIISTCTFAVDLIGNSSTTPTVFVG